MTRWIKKLHMYFGLLNFSILLVFGMAGLTATFEGSPETRQRPQPALRFESYTPPPGSDDKQVADDVYRFLKLPLTNPLPKGALRRDGQNNLSLDFYSINGVQRVTVLEKEGRLKIEAMRVSTWRYLDHLHSTTSAARTPDLRVRLWGYYNELAIWSLIGMAFSGAYLWLASRPGYRPAQYILAAGSGLFIALYVLTR